MDRPGRITAGVLIYDAAAYAAFCVLWDVNTVIPVFLDRLGSPPWFIGMTYALKQLGYLIPQLVMACCLHRIASLTAFIRRVVLVDRPQLLVFLLALWLLADNRAVIAAFFACFAVLCFGEGTLLVPWIDLMSRSIPPRARGIFWGIVQVAGGLAALGGGLVISGAMNNPHLPYPYNFLVIFGLGTLLLLPTVALFRLAEDPLIRENRSRQKWRQSVLACLNHRHFFLLLFIQILAGADALVIPHYIIMVRHAFPQTSHLTSPYIVLSILGGVAGGLLWGVLSNRPLSHRAIAAITAVKAVASAIFLNGFLIGAQPVGPYLFGFGFFLVGIVTAAWVGFLNYILNMATHRERPFFIALNNTFLIPVAVYPVLGGLLRQFCGDLLPCAVAAALCAGAFILSLRLKPPGTGKR